MILDLSEDAKEYGRQALRAFESAGSRPTSGGDVASDSAGDASTARTTALPAAAGSARRVTQRGAAIRPVRLGCVQFIQRGRGTGPATPRQPADRSATVPTPARSSVDRVQMTKD